MGKARIRAVILVAAALLTVGAVFAASAWARSLTAGGIAGRVYIGPLGPVRHTMPGLDGDEAGYQATIVVDDQEGTHEITRVRSDDYGEFRVTLPPGLYTLRPLMERQPFPHAKSMLVQVRAGAFTDAVVLYDLQIR